MNLLKFLNPFEERKKQKKSITEFVKQISSNKNWMYQDSAVRWWTRGGRFNDELYKEVLKHKIINKTSIDFVWDKKEYAIRYWNTNGKFNYDLYEKLRTSKIIANVNLEIDELKIKNHE